MFAIGPRRNERYFSPCSGSRKSGSRRNATRASLCQRLVTRTRSRIRARFGIRARFRIRTRFRIRLRLIITGAAADFEFAGAALVDPEPAVVVTPRLPANARRLRLLRDQPRVAVGIRLTAVIPVLATFARNDGARLRRRGERGQ